MHLNAQSSNMFPISLGVHVVRRIGFFVSSCVFAVAALPAIGQQGSAPVGPGPDFGYGYGHMGRWHPDSMMGPIVMCLILVSLIALVALGARFCWQHRQYRCPYCGNRQGRGALNILEERFAKGEIDKTEFEEKRKLLSRDRWARVGAFCEPGIPTIHVTIGNLRGAVFHC